MSNRDTIQEYIDLWAYNRNEDEIPIPLSPIPPPPPPKDSIYIRSSKPENFKQSHYNEDDDEDMIPVTLDLSEPFFPDVLHQLQGAFASSEEDLNSPSSVYSNAFSANADYTTIARSNPFDSPEIDNESPFTSYSTFSSESLQYLAELSTTPPPGKKSRNTSPQPSPKTKNFEIPKTGFPEARKVPVLPPPSPRPSPKTKFFETPKTGPPAVRKAMLPSTPRPARRNNSVEVPKTEYPEMRKATMTPPPKLEGYSRNPRMVSPAKVPNKVFYENPRRPPPPANLEVEFGRPGIPLMGATMLQKSLPNRSVAPRPVTPNPVAPSRPVTPFRPGTPTGNRGLPDVPAVNFKVAKMLGLDLPVGAGGGGGGGPGISMPSPGKKREFSRPTTPSSDSHTRKDSLQARLTENLINTRRPSGSGSVYDASFDASCIYKALRKAKKIDPVLLSSTVLIVAAEPYKLPLLRRKYRELYSDNIFEAINTQVSGNKYKITLSRLLAGPHGSEAQWFNGTHGKKRDSSGQQLDDKIVAEALFGKEREEISGIKKWFFEENGMELEKVIEEVYLGRQFHHTYTPPYTAAPVDNPSAAFGKAIMKILTTDRESEPPFEKMTLQQQLDRDTRMMQDIEDAYKLERRMVGNLVGGQKHLDHQFVTDMLITRPLEYLKDLCIQFEDRHGEELVYLLEKHLKNNHNKNLAPELPSNLAYALHHTLSCVISKPNHTAKLLDETMKSLGLSNENRLIARTVRMWFDIDPGNSANVRHSYQEKYVKNLEDKVSKVTGKGAWGELMKGIIQGRRVDLGLKGDGRK
ncbi:hypothetical protein RUND412_001364 [Rhizina undulata]